MCGCCDREDELGFEVGLVEVREHSPGIGGFVLRIEVDPAVSGVGESVQSLAGGRIAGPRFDRQGIAAGADRECDAGTVERLGGGEGLTIDLHGGDGIGDEVDECRIGETSGEVDDSARIVGVVIGLGVADIDMNRVGIDLEQLCPALRFVPCEIRCHQIASSAHRL